MDRWTAVNRVSKPINFFVLNRSAETFDTALYNNLYRFAVSKDTLEMVSDYHTKLQF